MHTVYKAMIYSIKLKMEFRILNQLIEITNANRGARSDSIARQNSDVAMAGIGKVLESNNGSKETNYNVTPDKNSVSRIVVVKETNISVTRLGSISIPQAIHDSPYAGDVDRISYVASASRRESKTSSELGFREHGYHAY